jgi:hypothetical protein
MPEVSIVIAARNAGRTIDAALNSVFVQTVLGEVEVLVVDNGSTDDTCARVRSYGGRARCLPHPHTEMAAAWNAGLAAASGRIVMLLRDQDLWMPRKVERQLAYLAAHPGVALLAGDWLSSGTPHTTLLDSADAIPVGAEPSAVGTSDEPVDPRQIVLSTVAVRRAFLDIAGPLNAALPIEDAVRDWAVRLAACGACAHQSVPVAVLRTTAVDDDGGPPRRRQRNLLQDTMYRRVRGALASAVHAADTAATRTRRPLRVLFEAASPMSLAVFAPVLRQLDHDPRLQFWFTSCDASWEPRTLFGAAGITERVVAPESVRWAKFEAYVNTDFWDMTWLPRRTRRVHFFHGVAGKYGLDAPVKIAPTVSTFDRLMFPNRDRLCRYAEAGLIDADSPQAALVGYPKVDCLVDGSLDRGATLARIGVSPTQPTVLYAPTWSPSSSLNTVGPQVIAALGSLGVNVIVKLHDRSYDARTRGSGGVDWKQRLASVCRRHGAHLVQDADASPWLHAADLLVTDHSSVGFEFMLLDRPIVVIHNEELLKHARVNPDKVASLRRAAFVVHDRDTIAATVRTALDRPLDHSGQRRKTADELFYCAGTATARAVQCMYDLLGLPQPSTDIVPSPARSVRAMASLARSL